MTLPAELTEGLPDCRLKGRRDITRPFRDRLGYSERERVFCANCGCDGGMITRDWAEHVFYVCDDCAGRLGPPHGVVEVPESQVRR